MNTPLSLLFFPHPHFPAPVNMSEKKDHEAIGPMDPKYGEMADAPGYSHDAVFGEMGEDGPNYRSVRLTSRAQASMFADRSLLRSDGWARQCS